MVSQARPPCTSWFYNCTTSEELNFREIAMVMDISESRTTQLALPRPWRRLRNRVGVAAGDGVGESE